MLEIQVDHHEVIKVDLYPNNFVDRWKQLFVETANSCQVNQLESFVFNLPEDVARQRLLTAIDTINQFLKTELIVVPLEINWDDQTWYNQLHKIFEDLSGPWGKPTRLFSIAPDKVKSAVRDLNFYVHRLEVRPYKNSSSFYISFDKNCYKRYQLEHTDYEYFQHYAEPGEAFIHYAELGKTHYDLYKDGLPTDYSGLKNLHYYSAEISIWLGKQPRRFFEDSFYEWADQNNIDVSSKIIGLGIIPIGCIKDVDSARKIVYNGTNITSLRINHGKTI